MLNKLKKLTDFEKCTILIGNYLGDGSYDNRGGILRNRHSNKQNEYISFLEDIFDAMGILQNVKYNFNHPTNIDPNHQASLVSAKVPIKPFFENDNFIIYNSNNLTKSGQKTYYKKGRKILTRYAIDNLHPLGLLLWYLDDGSLSVKKRFKKDNTVYGVQRQATISSMSFSYDEHLEAQKSFKTRFGIDFRIHKQKNKNPITQELNGNVSSFMYFNATNFRLLYDIVRPYLDYIPESMRYKFNMKYEINSRKNSKFLTENYNL
jgi:hypothetical protein